MRKAVSFNPHWIGDQPAWDIRLINGDIHRGVTAREVIAVSRSSNSVVLASDIAAYGKHHLSLAKPNTP